MGKSLRRGWFMAFCQNISFFIFIFWVNKYGKGEIGEKVRSVPCFYGSYPNRHLFLRKSKFICPV